VIRALGRRFSVRVIPTDSRRRQVRDNLAQSGAGDTGANGGDGQGGGVFVAAGSSAEIERTIILNDQALGGAGGAAGSDGQGVGGGIDIEPLVVLCLDTKTKVKHNTASTSNGDIFGTFTTC
jgi:hypothetical protein